MLLEESMGGLAAGIVGTIIGFPLDLIKTRMQTATSSSSYSKSATAATAGHKPRGIIQTATFIIRHEGILALYKGLVPPLISLSILNTMTFTTYSYFQSNVFQGQRNAWDGRNALAGATCGILASPISTVENLVKTQLQLDNVKTAAAAATRGSSGSAAAGVRVHHRAYTSTWDCVQQLLRTKQHPHYQNGTTTASSSNRNIWLLYRGHGVNTAREMVFLSTYFYLYEGLRHLLVQHHTSNSTTTTTRQQLPEHHHDCAWAVPLAGGLAGASAWLVSFPLDCVRAGVQGQDFSSQSSSSSSTSTRILLSATQVFWNLLETKGVRGLYAGVTPSLARAFLVSGSRFSAYEGALWLLRGGR
jgi:solute carrier family 25 (mitochondrial carnitine/acylcarnitine transporter), member 20/29